MKKNVRNILSAALVLALLAVLLIVPAMAEGNVTEVATYDQLVAALSQDGEIKLTDDIFYSNGYNDGKTLKIEADRNIVLDLNGHTLGQTVVDKGASVAAIAVRAGATLTVKDSSEEQAGKISACNTAIQLEGTLNLQSGTIAVDNPSPYDASKDTGWAYGVWCYMRSDDAVGPVFNMTGGDIEISDTLLETHAEYNFANAVACGDGASGVSGRYEKAVINITGGTLDGTLAVGEGTALIAPEDIPVYCITTDGYAVDSVAALINADGAKKMYSSLQLAIDAAAAGDTITLLKDIEAELPFNSNTAYCSVWSIGKSITLDGNGHRITINENNWQKYNNASTGYVFTVGVEDAYLTEHKANNVEVTIKNLTFVGKDCVRAAINVYAPRTFSSADTTAETKAVLDNVTMSGFATYTLGINNSTAVVVNSSIANGGWSYAIDVDKGTNALTVEGGTVGAIKVGGHESLVKSTITINGGTIYGVGVTNAEKTDVTISGGIFTVLPEEAYIIPGACVCQLENQTYQIAKGHELDFVKANDATYTTPGNTAYYACSVCGEYFEDAASAKPILDKNTVVIPANNNGEFQLNVPLEIDQDTYHYYLFTPDESGIYLFKSLWSGSTYIDRVRIAQTGTIIGHIGENVHAEDDIYAIFYELEAGTTYAIMISGSKNTYTVERPVAPTSIKFELDFEKAEFDDWFTWQTPLINYVTVYPYNAYADLDNELTFSTSDEKILALTDSSAWAFMEPVDAGKVTITAKLGNLTATDTVEVMPKPVLVPGKPATADRPFRMYWYFTPQHSGTYTLTVEFKDTGAWIAVGLPDAIDPILNESLSEAGTKTYKLEMEGGKEYFFVAEYDTSPVLTIGTEHELIKVDAVDATCTKDGNVEHYHCAACNKNFNADGEELNIISLGAVSHTVREVKAVAATCTEDGIIAHGHCDMCGKNFDADGKELSTVVVAAKGHKLTKVEAKEATCTEDGVIAHYNCSECKKNFSDEKGEKELTTVVVAAKGHKLTKVEAKEATYTEAGNIEHYACACGKLFADAEGKKEITDVVIPQLIKVEEEKAEVSEDAVDNALADAKEKAEETGKPVEVIIEVPKAPAVEKPGDGETSDTPEVKPQEIVKVELPVEALENVAKEEATLTVILPSVTVTVDTDALKSVTEQAAGNTVTLVVEQIEEETLTEKQQEVVKKYDVAVTIKAEFICQETNEKIWTEDNNAEKESGSVTVKMPFAPAEGTEGADYTVLFIDDDGTVKEIETAFVDGHLVFALEHFSEYVVVNTKTVSETPDTGDNAMLAPFAMLLALSFAGVAVLVSGKKKLI